PGPLHRRRRHARHGRGAPRPTRRTTAQKRGQATVPLAHNPLGARKPAARNAAGRKRRRSHGGVRAGGFPEKRPEKAKERGSITPFRSPPSFNGTHPAFLLARTCSLKSFKELIRASFEQGGTPCVRQVRPQNDLEPRSDSIRSEKALAGRIRWRLLL